MDKSLRTNLHLRRFSHAPNKFIYTCSAPPPSPPPYNVGHVYPLFHQSFNIVLGGGGGRGREKQRILKRITVFLLRLRSKNTKNECNYTSVPRNFVHHCLIFTSHSKMHNNRVFLALNSFRTESVNI